jgi:Putative prokaryotic signal transducing protein
MKDKALVVVHTFQTRQEADLALSALEAAGIDAMARSDDFGGLRPHLALVNGVEVLVRAEHAAAAREILDLPAQAEFP